MLKRIVSIVFVATSWVILTGGGRGNMSLQADQDTYKNNSCVNCHSTITTPVSLSYRYFEWHSSAHKKRGVGCEKCHGGDPAAKEKDKAHIGVLPSTEMQSRTHWQNLSETCKACHQAVVSSFVESKHYQQLRSTGMGPNCAICHEHMASRVAQTSLHTAMLCSVCHFSFISALPMRIDIPRQAGQFMQSLIRANTAVEWAETLLKTADDKKLGLRTEQQQLVNAQKALKDSKTSWHAFDLESSIKKADDAFNAGMKVKDELMKKLNP